MVAQTILAAPPPSGPQAAKAVQVQQHQFVTLGRDGSCLLPPASAFKRGHSKALPPPAPQLLCCVVGTLAEWRRLTTRGRCRAYVAPAGRRRLPNELPRPAANAGPRRRGRCLCADDIGKQRRLGDASCQIATGRSPNVAIRDTCARRDASPNFRRLLGATPRSGDRLFPLGSGQPHKWMTGTKRRLR